MKPWLLAVLLLGSLAGAQTARVTTLMVDRGLELLGQDASGLYVSQTDLRQAIFWRFPKSGGPARLLAERKRADNANVGAPWNARHVFPLGQNLYYGDGRSKIYKFPQAGGAPPSVVFELPEQHPDALGFMGLVSDGVDLYVFGSAFDLNEQQCVSGMNNALWRVPVLGGGKPMRLARGLACPQRFRWEQFSAAVDATNVYFLQVEGAKANSIALWRIPKRGGTAQCVLKGVSARGIAVDDVFVYTFVRGEGEATNLIRVRKDGGASQTLERFENPWFADGDAIVVLDSLAAPKLPALYAVNDGRVRPVRTPWAFKDVRDVTVDGATVYWMERVPGSMQIAFKRAPL